MNDAPRPGPRPATGKGEPATPPADGATALREAAGQALFRLGRLFGKAPQGERGGGSPAAGVELSRVLVAQAVEALGGEAAGEVTIGAVADWLEIDPSTASRLVADALRDGILARAVAATDNRRAALTLTAQGLELATAAREYQRGIFDEITRDWSDEERRQFARLFVRFASGVRALHRSPGVAPD